MWDLPRPEIKPMSPALAGGFFTTESRKTLRLFHYFYICYGDLWPVIFDVTIAKRLQLFEGSNDGENTFKIYILFFRHNAITHLLKVKVKSLSRVRLFATAWTVAYQAPPSMGVSRQEYWSGLPFPSPGDLPKVIKFVNIEFYWSFWRIIFCITGFLLLAFFKLIYFLLKDNFGVFC